MIIKLKWLKKIKYNNKNLFYILNYSYFKKINNLLLLDTNNFIKKHSNVILKFIFINKLYKKLKLKRKKKFKKKLKISFFKKILFSLQSKKKKIINIYYFIKYFCLFRRNSTKLNLVAKSKSYLFKKHLYLKKNYINKMSKYLSNRKAHADKHINISFLNLVFSQKKRFNRLDRLYDLRKKYIRYLSNNKDIYKNLNYKTKFSKSFIRSHFRSLSSLNLKDRFHFYQMNLRNFIISLKLAYSFKTSEYFIKTGYVFLNGFQNNKWFSSFFKHDCLELIFSKFIFRIRKLIKKKLIKSIRKYKRYSWRMRKNKVSYDDRRARLNKFALRLYNYKSRLSSIFQSDFRSMSFFVIKNINPKTQTSVLIKKIVPMYLLKLFNWKIVT